jgi:mono/diheme cytochrome c family protein
VRWHLGEVTRIVLAALATLGLLEGACQGNPAGDAVAGRDVFAKVCSVCHGPTGQPPAEMVARLGVKDLTAPELRGRITPELVEKQVRQGSQNKLMPALEGALTDAQIKSVAAWVASQKFVEAAH